LVWRFHARDTLLYPTMTHQRRKRLFVVAAAHVAASVAIAVLFRRLGQPVGIFGLVPVLVGAFSFGVRGGLASSFTQAALNAAVMQFIIFPPQPPTASSFVGIVAYFVLGAAVGNQRDLTRRVREALSRNEVLRIREQETLAAIPDTMIRVAPDGTCRLQGVSMPDSLEQVVERALGRELPPDRHTTIKECIEQVRDTGHEQGLTIESPGASSHDVRCLPTADGSVLIVMRDVTDQRKLLRRVTAAENLASLGTLAAGLAHEINNPLTYVITSITAVGQALPTGNDNAKFEVGAALDGCWRIRDLVQSILQTTNNTKDATEAIHVPEVIDAALTLVKSQVRHHASILWKPDDVPFALAHRTKLVQVVVNLVVNASQAFADSHTSEHEIRVRAYGDGQHVVIEVQDNGPGMDEKVRQRALEPFFTTKEPGQGSGLGLFLCNSIVDSLGGSLHIESRLGHGTTVTVRLPVAEQAPCSQVICRSTPSCPSEPATQLRVLIIDDEPEIRRALQRILSRKCAVSLSVNGAEAWQRFVNGETYDVILCDLLMPEMTGMDLFRALAKDCPDQAERVLFLTGGATSETTRIFITNHANRVVGKPFKPAEVEAAVRTTARFPVPIPMSSIAPAPGS
jgi:signal transduction histidine kinase/CheY-like chemotaxis protein